MPTYGQRQSGSPRQRWSWLIQRGTLAALLLIGLGLLFSGGRDFPGARQLRGLAIDSLGPMLSLARAPFEAVNTASQWVQSYLAVRTQNQALEQEVARSREVVEQFNTLKRENAELRALTGLQDIPVRRIGAFRIVGASPSAPARLAIITGGVGRGLRVGQPARDARGLVGRIIEVGGTSARVLLITDADSRVPVLVQRTGQTAMAEGLSDIELSVRYISGTTPLQPGDRLVTSGQGGVFPPGIPVGVVTTAGPLEARAQPFANPNGLDLVMVYAPYLPEAHARGPAAAPQGLVPSPFISRPLDLAICPPVKICPSLPEPVTDGTPPADRPVETPQ